MFDITMESINAFKLALIYTCMISFFGEHSCKGEGCNNDVTQKSAAVRLSTDLFCNYQSNIRPVLNESTQTNVNITFILSNIHMNEKWDVLHMNLILFMTWEDEFLKWDPLKYNNISKMNQESYMIWVPEFRSFDEGFNNEKPKYDNNNLPWSKVNIENNGTVTYISNINLDAYCASDISNWPFDSHVCTFIIGSAIYSNKEIKYTTEPSETRGFVMDAFHTNREWELKNITTECINFDDLVEPHCVAQYSMDLHRFSSMYYSSVIIPALVISLMRTFTFLMSHENSHRIILLCLFFISELFYLQFLDTKLPNNGENIVYIVLLYRNSLILTAITIVVSVVSNELFKTGTDDFPCNSPEWIKSVSTYLSNNRLIIMLTNVKNRGGELLTETNEENCEPSSQRNRNALFWKRTSILLDCLSLVIIFIISVLNFLVFIP